MIDIYTVKLLDILPESIRSDPQVRAMSEAISSELRAVSAAIAETILLPRIDELAEEIVDLLAYQQHVDFYEADLVLQQKRDLAKQSVAWHRRKGTKWAVEQVVSIIFQNAIVSEWFEYGGEPYFFRVETEETLKAETDLDRLVRLIDATKNTRSWLENITIKRTINMGSSLGGLFSEYRKTEIYPLTFIMPDIDSNQYYSGVASCWNNTTIGSPYPS